MGESSAAGAPVEAGTVAGLVDPDLAVPDMAGSLADDEVFGFEIVDGEAGFWARGI